MGGTSTGGLLALMLARLRAECDAVERTYLVLGRKLFDKCFLKKLLRVFFRGCKYSGTSAERAFDSMVREAGGKD